MNTSCNRYPRLPGIDYSACPPGVEIDSITGLGDVVTRAGHSAARFASSRSDPSPTTSSAPLCVAGLHVVRLRSSVATRWLRRLRFPREAKEQIIITYHDYDRMLKARSSARAGKD